MARQHFSPQHDLSGPAIFVPLEDSAWDRKRIDEEVFALRAKALGEAAAKKMEPQPGIEATPEEDPGRQHVFWRYYWGDTRYDLEAEGIAGYLDEAKSPERWHLRPLSSRDRAIASRLMSSRAEHEAWQLCVTKGGVVGCDNIPGELSDLLDHRGGSWRGKPVDAQRICEALDAISLDLVTELGSAVFRLSRDLSPEEKKV